MAYWILQNIKKKRLNHRPEAEPLPPLSEFEPAAYGILPRLLLSIVHVCFSSERSYEKKLLHREQTHSHCFPCLYTSCRSWSCRLENFSVHGGNEQANRVPFPAWVFICPLNVLVLLNCLLHPGWGHGRSLDSLLFPFKGARNADPDRMWVPSGDTCLDGGGLCVMPTLLPTVLIKLPSRVGGAVIKKL